MTKGGMLSAKTDAVGARRRRNQRGQAVIELPRHAQRYAARLYRTRRYCPDRSRCGSAVGDDRGDTASKSGRNHSALRCKPRLAGPSNAQHV